LGWRLPDRRTLIEVVLAAVLVAAFFYGVVVLLTFLAITGGHS
jgi:hypothetical protein